MGRTLIVIFAVALLVGGCLRQQVKVSEGRLSTNQRVAMVSSAGDGVSPPTNVVLYEASPGQMVPISTGYGQAPVTAFVAGAGAGVAVGLGNYAAARNLRPDRTRVSTNVSGGNSSATGGNSQNTNANTNQTQNQNQNQQCGDLIGPDSACSQAQAQAQTINP